MRLFQNMCLKTRAYGICLSVPFSVACKCYTCLEAIVLCQSSLGQRCASSPCWRSEGPFYLGMSKHT